MPALLPPRVDRDRRLHFTHAHVPALADGRGAELLPFQSGIGPVVLLQHAGQRAAGAGELAVVARPDAGGEIVRVVEERELHEVLEPRQRHRHQDGHEQLGGRELVLADPFSVPVMAQRGLRRYAVDQRRLHRLGVGAIVAADAPALADDLQPCLARLGHQVQRGLRLVHHQGPQRLVGRVRAARIHHLPAIHLRGDHRHQAVQGRAGCGHALQAGALVRGEPELRVREALGDLLQLAVVVPVVDPGPVAPSALEAGAGQTAARGDGASRIRGTGHGDDGHPVIGRQRRDALAEPFHLLDEPRVGAGREEAADHGGVRRRGEGVPFEDPGTPDEVRAGEVDHRDAPDEVHRGDDGGEPGGHERVAPEALSRHHVGDDLALDGRLVAALEMIAGALGLEEVLLRLQPGLGDLLADLVQEVLGVVGEDPGDVLHHVLAVRESLVRPGQRLPHLVAGGESGFDILLPGGGNVEQLHALVGGTGHRAVLAGGGRPPLAADEVADGQLPPRRQLAVAEEVGPQRFDVRVGQHPGEERVPGAALRVTRRERVGSELAALVERADRGLQFLVDEGRHGAGHTGGAPGRQVSHRCSDRPPINDQTVL